MSPALHVEALEWRFAPTAAPLFQIPRLTLAGGSSLGLSGPSGAGKTTLFHCLAGIRRATAGHIRWHDVDIAALDERARDRWRHRHAGLVFQDFHLVDGLGALDNVLLPAHFDRWRAEPAVRRRARGLLDAVGIADTARAAALLSRGERQRVALARALLFRPPLLLADEPTASLDPDSRHAVGTLLLELSRADGATLVVISHDEELLARLDRRLHLQDGSLHATHPSAATVQAD